MESSLSLLTEARVEIHPPPPPPFLPKNSLFLFVKSYDAKVLPLKFHLNDNMIMASSRHTMQSNYIKRPTTGRRSLEIDAVL